MIRSGAVLVGRGLLALLAAVLLHEGHAASWMIATSIGCTVAGVSLLVVAPWPTTRRPLRVQLVDDQGIVRDDEAVARALLAALDAAHVDRR